MAGEWELNTVAAINERRADLGLPDLEWSGELESEARNYWSNPALCPNIVRTCSRPHWTSPKQICELLWCDELCDYSTRLVAVTIFSDGIAHAALALNRSMIGGNMLHKRAGLHSARKTSEYRSVIGWITGRRSAMFLKERYQTELDIAHAALINEVNHGQDEHRRKALDYYNEVQALREDLRAYRASLDAHSAAQDSLSQGSEGRIEKQREIHKKEEALNRAVSAFNRELPSYKHNVQRCQEKLDRYYRILGEGASKIQTCRYVRSFLFKILPEDKKAEILLDILPHTIERWKTMIAVFTEDLSLYQKQPFSELPYRIEVLAATSQDDCRASCKI